MADFGDDMRRKIGDLMDSTPLVAAARGIAKVGEKAIDATSELRRKAASFNMPTIGKKKTLGDINLPPESPRGKARAAAMKKRKR